MVDDTAEVRKVVEAQLESQGYEVVLAENGEQALASFELRSPDLVLLDVGMPGIDGFETCRRVRALPGGGEVPIVFLTGLSDLGSHLQAVACGADDFLAKPIGRTELLLRVRSLLWSQRLRLELQGRYAEIRAQNEALLASRRERQAALARIARDLASPFALLLDHARALATSSVLPPAERRTLDDLLAAAAAMERAFALLDAMRRDEAP